MNKEDIKFKIGEIVMFSKDFTVYVGVIKKINIEIVYEPTKGQKEEVKYDIVCMRNNRKNPYQEIKGVYEEDIFVNKQKFLEEIERKIDISIRWIVSPTGKNDIYKLYNLAYISRIQK